jgi:hypothetical protein
VNRIDITWRAGGRVQAVVDAKCKSLVDQTTPNGDPYQMLADCIALGLPRGDLVYAKDPRRGDLELELPAQVAQIADAIAAETRLSDASTRGGSVGPPPPARV